MGFRTLAIEQRSAEVWRLLGAVKTEFGRFGDWLTKVREQVRTVSNTLDNADTRTRQMQRALKEVEALPNEQASGILPAIGETDA
jgi:DNA recombination protein RmuC